MRGCLYCSSLVGVRYVHAGARGGSSLRGHCTGCGPTDRRARRPWKPLRCCLARPLHTDSERFEEDTEHCEQSHLMPEVAPRYAPDELSHLCRACATGTTASRTDAATHTQRVKLRKFDLAITLNF